MSRDVETGSGHPVARFLDVLETGLDEVTEVALWSLDGEETGAIVDRLTADLARLCELESRVLTHGASIDVHGAVGMKSLQRWLAHRTRLTSGEASRKVRLAETLAAHEQMRAAMGRGEVHAEQAKVIATAVDALDEEHAQHRGAAEQHLIGQAAHFDAGELAVLGGRILEAIDPACAEEHEAKALEKQEAKARKATAFSMWDDGEGLAHGKFTIPAAQASMLKKALHGLAAPKHVRATEGAGSYDHEKPTAHRLGLAFVEYVERYPTDQLPVMGGLAASIVVTVAAEAFTKDAPMAGTTDTGLRVSPGRLTRWACESGLIPAVLDTDGHVLDLGRTVRLHTKAQRLALIVEQKTCQHPTCVVLGHFCHVHHTNPWSRGWWHQHPRRGPALPVPPPPGPHPARRLPAADVDGLSERRRASRLTG